MKKSKIFLIIGIVLAAVITGLLLFHGNEKSGLQKQLNLGNEALYDMDYESAILAFEEAIKIDPKNVEAYLGIAEAYIAMEDYENAYLYLTRGYEATGSAILRVMLLLVEEYINSNNVQGVDIFQIIQDVHGAVIENKQQDEIINNINQSTENMNSTEDGNTDVTNNGGDEGTNGDSDSSENNSGNNESGNEQNSEDTEENMPKEELSATPIAQPITPSSFLLFGMPINEDNYEAFKAAVGYSGNDALLGNGPNMVPSNGVGAYVNCSQTRSTVDGPADSWYFGIYNADYTSFIVWEMNHSFWNYNFYYRQSPGWESVIETNVTTPLPLGMPMEEVINVIGYDGDLTLNDAGAVLAGDVQFSYIEGFVTDWGDTMIALDAQRTRDPYRIEIYFANGVVSGVQVFDFSLDYGM